MRQIVLYPFFYISPGKVIENDVAYGAGFATIWGIRAMEEYDGEMILW